MEIMEPLEIYELRPELWSSAVLRLSTAPLARCRRPRSLTIQLLTFAVASVALLPAAGRPPASHGY
jgi:hypothetical protein